MTSETGAVSPAAGAAATGDQPAAAPPQAGRLKRLWGRLPGWLTSMEEARKSAFNLFLLIIIVVAVPVLARVLTTKAVIIHDIAIPPSLNDRGLSGPVIGQRLMDHLSEINKTAASKKTHADITGTSVESQLPDIQLPLAGINLAPFLSQIRHFLGYKDVKISGEITIEQPAEAGKPGSELYGMRLRVANEGVIYEATEASRDISSLIKAGAVEIMHRFDPVNLGYYFYRTKDYKNAYRMTETALSDDTPGDDGWAFNMRGLIERDLRNDQQAIRDFREAIKREPTFVIPYFNLSETLLATGQADEAAQVAARAIALAPKDGHGYSSLALALIEQGKTQEALAMMEKAVAENPRAHEAHFRLGSVRHRLELWDAAADSYQRAAEIKPDFAEAYANLSQTLYQVGKVPEAREQAQRAVDAAPKTPAPWNLQGLYAFNDHYYAEAAENFRKAISFDRSYLEAHVNFGAALSAQKKYPEAVEALQQALQIAPRNVDVLMRLADALGLAGRRREALDTLRAAAVIDPRRAELQMRLGRMQQIDGDAPGAIASYRAAIALDGSLAPVLEPELARLTQDPAAAIVAAIADDAQAAPAPQRALMPQGAGKLKKALTPPVKQPAPAKPSAAGQPAAQNAAAQAPGAQSPVAQSPSAVGKP